jgi:DNA-binding transcriptional ArsR family regulator
VTGHGSPYHLSMAFPDLAPIGALIADPTRATMLAELLDGHVLTAGELAARTGVTAQTASWHLSKLVEGGLLAVVSQGRHRYHRLAGPHIAEALEGLGGLAPMPKARGRFEREVLSGLRFARSCYGHLAGRLAVAMRDRFLAMGLIVPVGIEHEVTPAGESWFGRIGVDVEAARASRRSFARACLDWSERRPHLAGALGDALLAALVERGWILCHSGERAVELTQAGRRWVTSSVGLELSDDQPPASSSASSIA